MGAASPPGPDIVVIDSVGDGLSAAFTAHAARRGVRAVRLRLGEVARAVSVGVADGRAEVRPGWPLLIRPLRPLPPVSSPDERFLWTEAFATVWAAAALTSRPVVNRPNEYGWTACTTSSAAVTQLRAGWKAPPDEVFWHDTAPAPQYRLHRSLDDGHVLDPPSAGSFGRSRALPELRGWEQVIVVGDDGFRCTAADIGRQDIAGESAAAAAALGLSFAAVSWAVPASGDPAVATRINAFPSLADCAPVLSQVCDALVDRLSR